MSARTRWDEPTLLDVIPGGWGVCTVCGHTRQTTLLPSLYTGDNYLCEECLSQAVIADRGEKGKLLMYCPQDHQRLGHSCDTPNLLELGTRGTGKSTWLRWDAIIRCMMFPGFKALIIRRKIGDLRKSHLQYIGAEIDLLGVGHYRQTTFDVQFDNGSILQFSHCENIADVSDYLSSQWDYIGFDELSTFPLDMFLMISAAARTIVGKPYRALVRCCSNPLGIGAAWMKQWFVDRDGVDLSEYPDYNPLDFEFHFSSLDDNRFVNKADYEKRLRVLPDHVRRAWLKGEFVIEGAYFTDFQKKRDIVDSQGHEREVHWHVIPNLPRILDPISGDYVSVAKVGWIRVMRTVDWGYWPDPAVCHWHLLLPNRQKITFMEKDWKRTLAPNVAKDIAKMSQGMHITETWCDPTMFVKDGSAPFSIAQQFENNGVPLTASQNDRELYGYALHEGFGTLVHAMVGCDFPDCNEMTCPEHWVPSWQIVERGCPELIRTLPLLQMDKNDQRKVADGPDHWAVSCAYGWMADTAPSKDPVQTTRKPRWMLPRSIRYKEQFLVQ